jgi:hypothetical protein
MAQTFLSLCAGLILFSNTLFAFPVKVKKSIVIRSVVQGMAVNHGPYILRAGSVIDIPDEYLVRNSIGDVDIVATLLNWRMKDPSNGIFSMIGDDQKPQGQEAFFKLKVLQAAPGSQLPKDFVGFVALDFLMRTHALQVLNSPVALGKEASSDIPVPTPRPDPEEGSQEKATPTSPTDSQMFDLGGSGGGGAGAIPNNIPIPTSRPPTKDEVLQMNDADPGDLKVYEAPLPKGTTGSTSVTPSTERELMNPPLPKMSDVIASMKEATAALPNAGTADAVCPDGTCDVALAGNEEEEQRVCKQLSKGNFPDSLSALTQNRDDLKSLDAVIDWMSLVKKNPKTCKGYCSTQGGFLSALFSVTRASLNNYCHQIQDCSKDCASSKIVDTVRCSSAEKKNMNSCQKICSPYAKLGKTARIANLTSQFNRALSDLKKYQPGLAKDMDKHGLLKSTTNRMICKNLERENRELEPIIRPCSKPGSRANSTALGIGQVVEDTFYDTLGMTGAITRSSTRKQKCYNLALKDLNAKNCQGWSSANFRSELYKDYMNYTPKELDEMRTLDVKLQARISLGTFVNKYRYSSSKDLKSIFDLYFGLSDKKARQRIERCVKGAS